MDFSDIDLKIKKEFLTEAMDFLSQVEDQFLIFEQNPTDSSVVDRIFRMAHTVKGSAMACGFLHLGEFAHVMEALLVKIREGHHIPDSDTVDVLLRANDKLRLYIERLSQDYGAVLDTSLIEEEIRLYLGPETKDASAMPMGAFGFFDDDEEPQKETENVGAKDDLSEEDVLAFVRGHRLTAVDEATALSLKAYLTLSKHPGPREVKATLLLLHEALRKLALARP